MFLFSLEESIFSMKSWCFDENKCTHLKTETFQPTGNWVNAPRFLLLLIPCYVSRHATPSMTWRALIPADPPRMLHGGSATRQKVLASYQLHCRHPEDVWTFYHVLLAWKSQNRWKTKPSFIFSCVPGLFPPHWIYPPTRTRLQGIAEKLMER